MRKIFLLLYILVLSFICSLLIKYDTSVVINLYNYELITTTKILFLLLLITIMLNNFFIHSFYIVSKPNTDKYRNKIEKIKKLYEKYIYNISSGYLYILNRNISAAEKRAKESENILKNRDLTILLKTQINFVKGNFEKVIDTLGTIGDKTNKDYLINNILLREAIAKNDTEKIKEVSSRILKINRKDFLAVTTMYKINKFETRWLECKNLLKIIKKGKYFTKDEINVEEKLIACNICKNRKNFFLLFIEYLKKIFSKKSL